MRVYSGFAAVVLALVCLLQPPDAGAAEGSPDHVPRVLAVDAGPDGAGTLIEIDFDAAPVFRHFLLDEPRRLVIDFPRIGWAEDLRLPRPGAGIGEVRLGLFRADRARMVVELAAPMRVTTAGVSREGPGARLSVRLSPVTPEAFAAAAGWPPGSKWAFEELPAPRVPQKAGSILVAVDPGHGGIDPGATVDGMVEKHLVLEFGKLLADELNRTEGLSAFLTRERDIFLPLGARVRLAQRAGAHVFVSIHADTVREGDASGVSVYTLAPEATNRAAALLAERENRADILAGAALEGAEDDVARVLIELAQRGTMPESEALAAQTLAALSGQVELLKTRPHRKADFRVLKAPDIPSILLELGFLSNESDRERLGRSAWQRRAAGAVARGIAAWSEEAGAVYLAPR